MQVREIFHSIQGESTFAGRPCTFVRLTGCPLRCRWCDSEYTFSGGEPLLQPEVHPLTEELLDRGYTVLIETSGSLDISRLDPRAICIMDLKPPGSGHEHSNRWENVEQLKESDEVKFVIADRRDFDWACDVIDRYQLTRRATVLFSPAWGSCDVQQLAAWLLGSGADARLQVQLHK